ncbi:nuclear transport factor 2 family protein [Flavobacterium zepuense]|uniref:Nuclear transport factor 2 family protein n=1 Tax=Flavobacterium zepuense TaxID=2593302 RepID=A0A552V1H7_9FLAO|nr:nuclear transport factor 2 family protein [Flavobacterium zepuense]TRW24326.1 nuclear transport factor 2 family protein [Flavobacterium zepuense]
MKKAALLLLILGVQSICAQESEVKKSIQTFFEALQTRDTTKMQSVCYKHLILESIEEHRGQGRLDFEAASEFYRQIARIPEDKAIEERLLSYKIQIDGTLAHVWAPYEFYIDGKLSHSGVNSFQLFYDEGIWKIVYIIDTRRKK